MSQLVTGWEFIRGRNKRLTCSRLTQKSAGRRCRGTIEERLPTRSERGEKWRTKKKPSRPRGDSEIWVQQTFFQTKKVESRKHGPSVCGAYYVPMRKSSHRGGVNLTIGIGRQDEEWEAGSTRVLVEV